MQGIEKAQVFICSSVYFPAKEVDQYDKEENLNENKS